MLLKSLILTGAVNGLFFILLLRNKEQRSDSDHILMLWMGILALQLSFYYDNLNAQPIFPAYLQLLCFSLPIFSAPVFYFYIRSLSFGYNFKWKDGFLHLLPFVVFNILTFYSHYTGNLDLKDALPHFGSGLNLFIVYTLTGSLAIIPGYYALAGLWVLIKHQKALPDNYSYTEKINLDWLKWIVISLLVLFFGLFLFIKYGVSYGLVSYPDLFVIVGVILTLYVFFIGFCGLKQRELPKERIIEVVASVDTPKKSYKNSGLGAERINELFDLLLQHMADNKPFLHEDISLSLLASQVGVTANQLSQVINQKTQSNFFNFINNYRVEAVKHSLKDPAMSHYSILGIAYSCGFRSKSSFNKIFKQTTGLTPLEYQKSAGSRP